MSKFKFLLLGVLRAVVGLIGCFLVVGVGLDDRDVARFVAAGPPVERVPVSVVAVLLLGVLTGPDNDIRVPSQPIALRAPDQILSRHGQHHVSWIHKVVHAD